MSTETEDRYLGLRANGLGLSLGASAAVDMEGVGTPLTVEGVTTAPATAGAEAGDAGDGAATVEVVGASGSVRLVLPARAKGSFILGVMLPTRANGLALMASDVAAAAGVADAACVGVTTVGECAFDAAVVLTSSAVRLGVMLPARENGLDLAVGSDVATAGTEASTVGPVAVAVDVVGVTVGVAAAANMARRASGTAPPGTMEGLRANGFALPSDAAMPVVAVPVDAAEVEMTATAAAGVGETAAAGDIEVE